MSDVTWTRVPRLYDIDGTSTTLNPIEYTGGGGLGYLPGDDDLYVETEFNFEDLSASEYTWRVERTQLSGIGIIGLAIFTELRIRVTSLGSGNYREDWEERHGTAFYNSQTQEYENIQWGDWESLDTYLVPQQRPFTRAVVITIDSLHGSSGTYSLQIRFSAGGVLQEVRNLGGVVIRDTTIGNIRTKCSSDPLEGPATITFDIICQTPDWQPTGSIEWSLKLIDQYDQDISPTGSSGFVTAHSPTSAGVVATVEVEVDGLDSNGEYLTADVFAFIRAVATVPGTGQNYAQAGAAVNFFHKTTCDDCSQNEAAVAIPVSLYSQGSLSGFTIIYRSLHSCRQPSSLGYGWSFTGSETIKELPSDAVVHRNEFGMVQRWELDNGEYVSVRPDNDTKLSVNSNSTEARYVLTSRNQTVRNFHADGRPTSITDRNGNSISYNYSGSSITSISDGRGRTLYFNYGSRTDGQPIELRADDPLTGRSVSLEYYPDNHELSPNRLKKVTNALGLSEEFEYDEFGRLAKHTRVRPNRGNLVTTNFYDKASNRLSFQNLFGHQDRLYAYGYDAISSRHRSLVITNSIENGETTDSRNVYFARDLQGRPTVQIVNYNTASAS